ncbi:MAG: winged helix-turn-helix domain-containing protein [Acidobacteria bacterium]|nr:winged helix-turn-helix domain-containing protein [Acidobacteriota bacterium]
MSQPINHLYEFGAFRLNVAERLLLREEQPVALKPKAFDLLLVLIEQRGRLLEKEELLKLVWPETFVEESTLAWNVSQLRKTLGDDGNGNSYIETVPKHGYRFVAEVREVTEAELPVSTKPQRYRTALFALLPLVFIAAALFYFTRKPTLTERDPILLADFDNQTGEAIWDGTLKQALAATLEQSPYLNIFADERARATLKLMGKPDNERITRSIGREICQRRGVKVLLVGTIAKLERRYSLSLEAIDSRTGNAIARAFVEADGKDQVLRTLGRSASELRQKLGESLASIQKFDVPIEETTTSSLEALQAYSMGVALFQRGTSGEAVPFLRRAVELDAQFASAWRLLGAIRNQSAEGVACLEKAWQLRDRVSEIERHHIMTSRYIYVTKELDKLTEAATMMTRSHPNNFGGFFVLGTAHALAGRLADSVVAYQELLRLNPDSNINRNNLAGTLLRLNRYDEAAAMAQENLQRQPNSPLFRMTMMRIAFARQDEAEMQRQVAWFAQTPYPQALSFQAQTQFFAGRKREASELMQQAYLLAGARNQLEEQLHILSTEAAFSAQVGLTAQARAQAERALALQRSNQTFLRQHLGLGLGQPFLGWTFALSGDAARTQALTDELVRENPQNTLVLSVIAPLTHATIALQRGQPAKALELLQPTSLYEASSAAMLRPNWLRGQAYLQLKRGAEAAAEFQKIIDHRGWDVASLLWPLAHLGLARAALLQDDAVKARWSYEEFFKLWKDADAELPVLIEAKKEHAKLK